MRSPIQARSDAARPACGRRLRQTVFAVVSLGLLPDAGAADPFLRHTVTVDVVERVGPAVVNITSERVVRGGAGPFAGDPFFRDFFESRLPRTAQSLGSGVLIDAAGHILTNEHVVAHADRIRVALSDGREFEARLIGADANNDIAVLVVEGAQNLPWVPLGSVDDLMVGEPVIAIGNPFGLSSTVTTGVISALNRSIRSETQTYHGFLQTDASINPGNSGGPLLNAEGSLIGINTAVYQAGQGIGFAIPIDVAQRVVEELIQHGEVTPVWLGLGFQTLTPELAQALALPSGARGALVSEVDAEGPAARGGVERGDVVTHFDGRPVDSARTFFEMLETVTQNQELELGLLRAGKARAARVRAIEFPDAEIDRFVREILGLELEAIAGGGYRVKGVAPGSNAARIGLQPGDLLLAVQGLSLESREALRRGILDLRGRSRAQVVVQRGKGRYHVTIPLT